MIGNVLIHGRIRQADPGGWVGAPAIPQGASQRPATDNNAEQTQTEPSTTWRHPYVGFALTSYADPDDEDEDKDEGEADEEEDEAEDGTRTRQTK